MSGAPFDPLFLPGSHPASLELARALWSTFTALMAASGVEPMDLFSSLEVELSARSAWMPNVDSLDFVHDPTKNGPYQCQTPDLLKQPNAGLYALKATPKNHIFLEYESRLCDILRILELMEDTEAREGMEDRVIQELIRINRSKEVEWSGQRSKRGIKGAVVNTGMLVSSRYGCCC
jgi:hypothetical protein